MKGRIISLAASLGNPDYLPLSTLEIGHWELDIKLRYTWTYKCDIIRVADFCNLIEERNSCGI
jgi:hypothetical protein